MEQSPKFDAEPMELRTLLMVGLPLIFVLLIFGTFVTAPRGGRKPAGPLLGGHIDYIEQPDAAQAEVVRLAVSSHGDFSHLSSDDRRWLDSMTAGHGAQLIAREANNLKKRSTRRAASQAKGGVFKSAGPQSALPH